MRSVGTQVVPVLGTVHGGSRSIPAEAPGRRRAISGADGGAVGAVTCARRQLGPC
jgi:hypothetical protein